MATNKPIGISDLLRVDPKSREQYRRFSLAHLTAYSVHWLLCWDLTTSYENISVLNARLFPEDFGLAGFPGLPDAMRTNRSLLQLRPKYRGFATSDPRRGVYLTEKGKNEVNRLLHALGEPTFGGKAPQAVPKEVDPRRRGRNRERTRNPASEVQNAKRKLLYRLYEAGRMADAGVVHFLGLIGLYDHTPPSEIRRQMKQIQSDAEAVGDSGFLDFLAAVAEQFASYINRPDVSPGKREE